MTCDLCGKEQATVHLTEIVNEKVTELHLCEACANEKSVQMDQNFGLADLLAGLADFGKIAPGAGALQMECPVCSMGYEDFRKIGRLGCSECYGVFAGSLGPLIKRIQGASKHLGKAPSSAHGKAPREAHKPASKKRSAAADAIRMSELKQQLQTAIAREDFEEAARVRDQIKKLEAQHAEGGAE